MRRLLPVLAAAIALAGPARSDAQMGRAGYVTTPHSFAAFSAGIFQTTNVRDGTTASNWAFGDAIQYRVTLEKATQNQSSFGIAASFAKVPLTYTSQTDFTCPCDADAQITQVLGTFHAGGTRVGFHQVIDLDMGATWYHNFRETGTGRQLAPKSDADLTLGLGYGFGYTFSPTFQFELVQQYMILMHQRDGLQGGDATTARQTVTRIGVRLGLGVR